MGLFVFLRKVFFDAHGRPNERCHQTDKCQFADERPVGWADCDSDQISVALFSIISIEFMVKSCMIGRSQPSPFYESIVLQAIVGCM